MPKTANLKAEKELVKEMKDLARELRRLKNLEFVQVLNHPWRLMWLSFVKGAMVGFGSIVGAGILVGVFIYIMSKVSFVPIIGDFIQDLMGQIDLSAISPDSQS